MNITEFQSAIATVIRNDELKEGDIIRHLGGLLQVISEPEYTSYGIEFNALWLDIDSPNNTQQLCFNPNLLVELVSHFPVSSTQLVA